MKRLKNLVFNLLRYSGLSYFIENLLKRKNQHLILIYHSVSGKNNFSVKKSVFEEQIKFIARTKKVITFTDLTKVDSIKGDKLIITFDDGLIDNYVNAYPLAFKYNLPIHIFLVSENIGKPGYLDWSQIKEMKKSGLVSFGNHSKNHVLLNELDEKGIINEINDSHAALKVYLKKLDTFSYPFGDKYDDRSIKILKNLNYKYAVTWIPGVNDSNTDLLQLKRVEFTDFSCCSKFKIQFPNLFFWFKKV